MKLTIFVELNEAILHDLEQSFHESTVVYLLLTVLEAGVMRRFPIAFRAYGRRIRHHSHSVVALIVYLAVG